MQEEFHAETINGATVYKRLYGWSTLTANVWLPSLCELVGYTGTEDTRVGTYYSAMQGLNTSNAYDVDLKGGAQWELFQAYNTASGGEKIWNICKEASWIRSPDKMFVNAVWVIAGSNMISWNQPVTVSRAVHPAVSPKQVSYLSLILKRIREKLIHSTVLPYPSKAGFAGNPIYIYTHYHLFVGNA